MKRSNLQWAHWHAAAATTPERAPHGRLGRPTPNHAPRRSYEYAPPPFDAVRSALEDYTQEIAAMRRAGMTRSLSADAAERFFALGFALDQVQQIAFRILEKQHLAAAGSRQNLLIEGHAALDQFRSRVLN